jgi:hypothetical protein
MKAKRSILRIQLDRAAKEGLERLCEQRGMTQIAVMSRLVDWFIKQDEIIQLAALGVLSPQVTGPLARKILERMAAREQVTRKDD